MMYTHVMMCTDITMCTYIRGVFNDLHVCTYLMMAGPRSIFLAASSSWKGQNDHVKSDQLLAPARNQAIHFIEVFQ